MTTRLYHREVYWPLVQLATGVMPVVLTNHARGALETDRYGRFSLPSKLNIQPENIFEIELEQGRIVKQVARLNYDDTLDVIVAFIPRNGQAIVKTAWLNKRSDKHRTLKRHLYAKA